MARKTDEEIVQATLRNLTDAQLDEFLTIARQRAICPGPPTMENSLKSLGELARLFRIEDPEILSAVIRLFLKQTRFTKDDEKAFRKDFDKSQED